ncbi:MAG: AI-2E family transporter [Natrialbaceae archaeon]|nr:AI-2E family transporter [Natrialbaceae archaeon]
MRIERGLLLGLVGLLLVLSTLLVLPYAQYVLGAATLAYLLHPLHRRLEPRVGATISASMLVLASVVAIILPVIVLLAVVADEAVRIAQSFDRESVALESVEAPIEQLTGQDIDLESMLTSGLEQAGQGLAGSAVSAVEFVSSFLIGIGLAIFLLYYLLRDGAALIQWLRRVSPLSASVTETLIERIDSITAAVLAGHVLVAIIQGVIAGIGLAIFGIPNTVFWTVIMVILALIPIIGSFVVWAPASGYLALTGEPVLGAGLFVYGFIVVGVSDEYLRPVIVDRYASINPAVIIIGVIGGLSVFGFMGLFVGPIIVGALREAIEVYDTTYQ